MRFPAAVAYAVAALAAALLGFEQAAASLALRERAVAPAWPRLAPGRAADALERSAPGQPLWPPVLRLVLARRALEMGDLPLVERSIATLPPSPDRQALAGALAERRGEVSAALGAYLSARDVDDAERVIAALTARKAIDPALAAQHDLIATLQSGAWHAGALPEAYYRLGLLQQESAYRLAVGAPDRTAQARLALAAYQQAVARAPLAERYQIAAGNQELNLGDLAAATGYFRRALDLNPGSVEGLLGLGAVALRRGNAAGARALFERARRLDPNGDSVRRFEQALRRSRPAPR